MTNTLTSTAMAFLILFGSLASADAADLLILNSTQSGLPEGSIIDGTATLSIAAGARLTLVSEAGGENHLEGTLFRGAGRGRATRRKRLRQPHAGGPVAADRRHAGGSAPAR